MKLCIICQQENNTKYQHCSDSCKKEYHKQKQQKQYDELKEKHKIQKLKLVNKMGGKCSECNYNINLASLVFHHKESSESNKSLDARNMMYMEWDELLKESEKCILLCHNCQRELLYGGTN